MLKWLWWLRCGIWMTQMVGGEDYEGKEDRYRYIILMILHIINYRLYKTISKWTILMPLLIIFFLLQQNEYILEHLYSFVRLCNENYQIGLITVSINRGCSLRNSTVSDWKMVREFDFSQVSSFNFLFLFLLWSDD